MGVNTIKLKIDTANLVTVVQNCTMGNTTISNPMVVDSFVSVNSLSKIEQGETVNFKIKSKDEGYEPKIVCAFIYNVEKNEHLNQEETKQLFDDIFDCNEEGVDPTIDGALCLAPKNDSTCQVALKSYEGKLEDHFFYFTVTFSLDINGKTHFFKIDPVVRTRTRPSSRP